MVPNAERWATDEGNYQVVGTSTTGFRTSEAYVRRNAVGSVRIVDRDQIAAQSWLLYFELRISRHGQPGIGNMRATDSSDRLVYVLDDDPAVRQTLSLILSSSGYSVICFADGPALLHAARVEAPFCILLDVFLGETSGIDILKQLNARQSYPAPIFVMSGRGTIPLAIDSIRCGACDFVEKPFKAGPLIEKIEAGARDFGGDFMPPGEHQPLTKREQQILRMAASGMTNRDIASALALSPRTIEYHRMNVMKKMHAKNPVELVHMYLATNPHLRHCLNVGMV